jgi:L-2-hydroxyglutarate oxidase LhgO
LPFQHLIYPIPEPGGLGVHATIDWAGQSIKFGPDVEWVDPSVEDPSTISLRPDPQRGVRFYEQVRKYWPDLPNDALVPDYVGIRPKLNHPSQGTLEFQDFLIAGQATHGVKGLVHLLGIESPGLTSSMAIGDYVASQL